MDYNRSRFVLLHNPPVEGQDGCGIVCYSVVRPGCEVELSHLQSTFSAACQLWGGGGGGNIQHVYLLVYINTTTPVLARHVWCSVPVSAGQ